MNKVSVSCRIRGVSAPANAPVSTDSNNNNGTLDILADNKLCVRHLSGSNGEKDKDIGGNSNSNSTGSSSIVFELDQIFDQHCTQEELFNGLVRPIIDDALAGFNATLFTYGQTGSGKTYCMEGKLNSTPEVRGIVPRTVDHLFDYMNANFDTTSNSAGKIIKVNNSGAGTAGSSAENSCEVRLSVMQIYQEKLFDLLINSTSKDSAIHNNRLRIREFMNGGSNSNSNTARGSAAQAAALASVRESGHSIFVEGLTELKINSPADFEVHMTSASKKRSVGSHNMNSESSRSHLLSILTVIQTKVKPAVTTTEPNGGILGKGSGSALASSFTSVTTAPIVNKLYSKIYLVDLAGSEMVRKTDASGQRLNEAKFINKSLSALGNVICALTPVEGEKKSNNGPAHIPYRDSKLTRVLQDSLGGNAKTALILTISAHQAHIFETLATLRFGERARQLKTKPRINLEGVSSETSLRKALELAKERIKVLMTEVLSLKQEQEQAKCGEAVVALPAPASVPTPVLVIKEVEKPLAEPSSLVCSVCKGVVDRSEPLVKPSVAPAKSTSAKKSVTATVTKTTVLKAKVTPPVVTKRPEKKVVKQPTQTPTPEPEPEPEPEPVVDVVFEPIEEHEIPPPEPEPEPEPISEPEPEPEAAVAEEDMLSRCTVCGLCQDESDVLLRDTGEYLGELFACDGNCGGTFHVKCAGVIGEAGQYCLPDGEWFCPMCTASMYNSADGTMCSDPGYDSAEELAFLHDGENNNNGKGHSPINLDALELEGDIADGSGNTSMSNPLQEEEANIINSIADPRVATLLTSTVTNYHIMRRERNRILTQWQHEKKISVLLETNRNALNRQRDEEFTGLQTRLDILTETNNDNENTMQRLQSQNDELWRLLKELSEQQITPNSARSNFTSSPSNSNGVGIVHSSSTNTSLELEVGSLAEMVDSVDQGPGLGPADPGYISGHDYGEIQRVRCTTAVERRRRSRALKTQQSGNTSDNDSIAGCGTVPITAVSPAPSIVPVSEPDSLSYLSGKNTPDGMFSSRDSINSKSIMPSRYSNNSNNGNGTGTGTGSASASASASAPSIVSMPKLIRKVNGKLQPASASTGSSISNVPTTELLVDSLDTNTTALSATGSDVGSNNSGSAEVTESGIPKMWKSRSTKRQSGTGTGNVTAGMGAILNSQYGNTSLKTMMSGSTSGSSLTDTGRRLLNTTNAANSTTTTTTTTTTKNDNKLLFSSSLTSLPVNVNIDNIDNNCDIISNNSSSSTTGTIRRLRSESPSTTSTSSSHSHTNTPAGDVNALRISNLLNNVRSEMDSLRSIKDKYNDGK